MEIDESPAPTARRGGPPAHGVILCGGRSRRMGRPKALLPWGRGTLLEHARDRLRSAGLDPVLLGPGSWAEACGLDWLPDAVADAGPLGGLLAALALGDIFALAVDLPLLSAGEIATLAREGSAAGVAVIPWTGDTGHPFAAFWPASLRSGLRRYVAAGGRSALDFLAEVPHRRIWTPDLARLGIDPTHFANVNTPEDYVAARRAAGQARGGGDRP